MKIIFKRKRILAKEGAIGYTKAKVIECCLEYPNAYDSKEEEMETFIHEILEAINMNLTIQIDHEKQLAPIAEKLSEIILKFEWKIPNLEKEFEIDIEDKL